MSSQIRENQEALSGNSKSKLASTVNLHAPTETVPPTSSSDCQCDSANGNQTTGSTEPSDSYPCQDIPHSPLPPYNLQPELLECGQDNAMDVDNNLDYNTNTDLSAMVVDDSESKSIHLLFTKLYPTPLSSLTDASEKEGQEAGLKRRREEDDDFDEKDNAQNNLKRKPRKQTLTNLRQNIGIGRSTKASRALNEKVASGSFVLNPKRWMSFREKVILLDRDAITEPKSVRHSKCGKFIQMKEPYNIAYFESHVAKCKKRTTSNMMTIKNMFKNHPQPKREKIDSKPSTTSTRIPCPGLSASDHPRIPLYLERTPATGGGSSKINKISASLYPEVRYTDLSTEEQQNVLAAQRLERRWRNEHDLQRVYSMECKKVAQTSESSLNDYVGPCYQCLAILSDPGFRKVLLKEKPDSENVKYTPKMWINDDAVVKWGNIRGLMPIIQEFNKVTEFLISVLT